MTSQQLQWLTATAQSARAAQHVFPDMAASEAALESGYGTSALAREALNLFGMKQHKHPIHGTLTLPTKEYLSAKWEEVNAEWVKYDTLAECFEDRMATLKRLALARNAVGQLEYPHYDLALKATDPVTYIYEVSQSWSTDPQRSAKCLAIYNVFTKSVLDNSADVQDAANGEN